ncbi:MAG TPA: hypothetical protein PK802_07310 [Candidatus Cloacimonadota bacterium]|nr:hypothetical protein [Candidatus Cloacimonadota bacterium]
MTFAEQILALYKQHGRMHLVPFIGDAYHNPKPGDFRVIALGINAYLSKKDYDTAPEDVGQWFRNWWRDAAHGEDTWPYYSTAYIESDGLAQGLRMSRYFRGLNYVSDPAGKPCLYATNAIKVFLPEQHKDAATISTELLRPSTQTWHQELDLMAQYRVFPHLVVVFGEVIWEWIWKSFSAEYAPRYEHFQIQEYSPCARSDSPVFHRANRVRVATSQMEQTVFLVRPDHPAWLHVHQRGAQWLLEQADIQILAGLNTCWQK